MRLRLDLIVMLGLCAVGLTLNHPVRAQLSARPVLEARYGQGQPDTCLAINRDRSLSLPSSGTETSGYLVALAADQDPQKLGLLPGAPGIAVFKGCPDAALASIRRHSLFMEWPVSRHPQLDRALFNIGLLGEGEPIQQAGKGVVIGILDTGIDVVHPDLRRADGSTRVAWFIDFQSPVYQPRNAIEEESCCTDQLCFCRVYDAAELDQLISNSIAGDEPRDSYGHGTHVASLAAGNGLAFPSGRYRGVAPESTLVVARITRSAGGGIDDADALLAARFTYERAEALGMPAVVNLSLGSNLGAHDGSSLLERGLSGLVGPEYPGRVMVVAAGNSGALADAKGTGYPGPLGVHTEVHVPWGGTARVPLLTPTLGPAVQQGSLYVWVASAPEDDLQIGLESSQGQILPLTPQGSVVESTQNNLRVALVNGPGESQGVELTGKNALLVIEGSWPAGEVFGVVLGGHGTAQLWVESDSVSGAIGGGTGAVFSGATAAATLTVPATASELIAVGATVNRTEWWKRSGVQFQAPIGTVLGAEGTVASFSGLGPTALGQLKPDLVAPGQFLIGAMAELADPRRSGGVSLFQDTRWCTAGDLCLVTDDQHGVAQGTSMAAPLVAGAAALLLEGNPRLTQDQVRMLLQAGTREAAGTGASGKPAARALDVAGALRAQAGHSFGTVPTSRFTRLVLSDTMARPGSSVPLTGKLILRGDNDEIVDGFSEGSLQLALSLGSLSQPLQREGPGLWAFSLNAPAGTGGQRLGLQVYFDRRLLTERSVPVAVDHAVAERSVQALGGCNLGPGGSGSEHSAWVAPLLGAAVFASRLGSRRLGGGRLGGRRRY